MEPGFGAVISVTAVSVGKDAVQFGGQLMLVGKDETVPPAAPVDDTFTVSVKLVGAAIVIALELVTC